MTLQVAFFLDQREIQRASESILKYIVIVGIYYEFALKFEIENKFFKVPYFKN